MLNIIYMCYIAKYITKNSCRVENREKNGNEWHKKKTKKNRQHNMNHATVCRIILG